jgi:hypothetical protein
MVTTQQKTRTIVIPANADPHQAALLPEKHPPPVYNRFVQRFPSRLLKRVVGSAHR